MCKGVCFGCLHVSHLCAWCSLELEEGIRSLELESHIVVSCPMVLGTEPYPLEEH